MSETYRQRLGTTDDRSYVVVDVALHTNRNPGTHQTTDHGTIVDPLELSVTGEIYAPHTSPLRGHDAISAGQIVDMLAEIVKPAPGWTLDEIAELQATWQRWHLNLMRAGCVHQTTIIREQTAYGPRVDLDATTAHPDNACPAGYRYGSAWLTEELPTNVVARVRELMRDRSEDLYRARGYDGAGRPMGDQS